MNEGPIIDKENIFFFTATLDIVGINPFVFVPEHILLQLFCLAGRNKGPVPVQGEVNGLPYRQNLMFYKGHWRLYINTSMLKNSPKRIGEEIQVAISIDLSDRSIAPHPLFVEALQKHTEAEKIFNGLPKSLRHEIVRYISRLKTEEAVQKNVARAINFLLGKERFIGRERP